MNKVVFRVDASLEIGNGHVMRCLTLADVLRGAGTEVFFISRSHPGNLIDYIQSRGYQVFALAPPKIGSNKTSNNESDMVHADWLGASQLQDAEECIIILDGINPEWLVVDHYSIDYRWHAQLRVYCLKLMVIDDLADRRHDCDLLLDQTYGRSEKSYQGLVPQRCHFVMGAKFALLRPEFEEWREYSLTRRKKSDLKKLLITMGGVDANNVTGQLIEALKSCKLPSDAEITVVMGQTAPHYELVQELTDSLPYKTSIQMNVNNMAELMANADLSIGAAGTTTWERFCLGLPTVLLALAENQLKARQVFNSIGIDLIDVREKGFLIKVCDQVEKLFCSKNIRDYSDLVDGRGSKRVMRVMDKALLYSVRMNCKKNNKENVGMGALSLQLLRQENIEQVRQWRNSGRVLHSTISKKKITKEQQIEWFNGLSVKDWYFKIMFREEFIGVASLKYNTRNNGYDPGIFIGIDEYDGSGAGFAAAFLLTTFGFDCLKLESIAARILKSNSAAIRMNAHLGYLMSKECGDSDEYILTKEVFYQKRNGLIELISRVV